MKLLLFSDLHADVEAAQRIAALAREADVLVGAGDFGTVRRDVAACLPALRSVGKPAVLVPGNNETAEELTAACRGWDGARILHGSGLTIDGVAFFGIGGGVPVTPFGAWSFDFSEEQAETMLAGLSAGGVLISHSPPRGAVDRDSAGRSLGSTAVRAAIERARPALVVCGHIHGSGGQTEWIGETPVVNAGPRGIVWDLTSGAAT